MVLNFHRNHRAWKHNLSIFCENIEQFKENLSAELLYKILIFKRNTWCKIFIKNRVFKIKFSWKSECWILMKKLSFRYENSVTTFHPMRWAFMNKLQNFNEISSFWRQNSLVNFWDKYHDFKMKTSIWIFRENWYFEWKTHNWFFFKPSSLACPSSSVSNFRNKTEVLENIEFLKAKFSVAYS